MRAYQSTSQQTVFDAALVVYGTLDGGLERLLRDNPEALLANGTIAQFGATYRTGREPVDARVANKLANVPIATGATADDSGAWLNAQVVPWVTANDPVWQLPSLVPGASSGARPDYFGEETDPTDDNFEVYSQKGGVNKRARLSKVGPRIAAVNFVPSANGNTAHLNTVVTDPNGDVYFISGTGSAVKLNSGGTAQAAEWAVYEQWASGSTVAWSFTLPSTTADLKEKVMLFKGGLKLRYGSDWTRNLAGAVALVVPADNEVFEIYIHKSLV